MLSSSWCAIKRYDGLETDGSGSGQKLFLRSSLVPEIIKNQKSAKHVGAAAAGGRRLFSTRRASSAFRVWKLIDSITEERQNEEVRTKTRTSCGPVHPWSCFVCQCHQERSWKPPWIFLICWWFQAQKLEVLDDCESLRWSSSLMRVMFFMLQSCTEVSSSSFN